MNDDERPTDQPDQLVVVLDSNILIADFSWKRAPFRLLLGECRRGKVQLVVPRLVLRETASKYADWVAKALRDLGAAQKRLSSLGFSSAQALELPDMRQVRADFEKELEGRVSRVGGLIADYPPSEHSDLVERLLDARKPFGSEGRGYRDSLLWGTVLDLAQDGDRVVLVSSNSRDFAESEEGTTLHPQLREDLRARSLPDERVTLLPNLNLWIEAFVEPALVVMERVRERLSRDRDFRAEVSKLIENAIEHDLPYGSDVDVPPIDLPYEDLTYGSIYTDSLVNLEVEDARMLSSDDAYLRLYGEVDADLEGFVFKSDLYAKLDVDVTVTDPDWNKHYAAVSLSKTVGISLEGTYSLASESLSDVRVVETSLSLD